MANTISQNWIRFLKIPEKKIENYYSIKRNGKEFNFKFEILLQQKNNSQNYQFNKLMLMFEKQGKEWKHIKSFEMTDKSDFQAKDIETHFDVTRDRILEKVSENYWNELLDEVEIKQNNQGEEMEMENNSWDKYNYGLVLEETSYSENYETKLKFVTSLNIHYDKVSFNHTNIFTLDGNDNVIKEVDFISHNENEQFILGEAGRIFRIDIVDCYLKQIEEKEQLLEVEEQPLNNRKR